LDPSPFFFRLAALGSHADSTWIIRHEPASTEIAVNAFPLKMDAAIKSADSAQFPAAFGELTAACNACHQGMEHLFLKIKVHDAAAMQPYINQDFAPDTK
jgi:hypothetical protein